MKRKITIVGLGHGNEDQLTLEAVKALQQGPQALLLTGKHGTVPYLQQLGVKYKSMDDICRNYDNYDDACNAMIQLILCQLGKADVVLGVPGHPLVGERLVFELVRKLDRSVYDVHIIPGISAADAMAAMVQASGVEGLKILTGSELDENCINVRMTSVIVNICNDSLAARVKKILLRFYPPNLEVFLSSRDANGNLQYSIIPLHRLDEQTVYHHTTCLYIPRMNFEQLETYDINHLCEIMNILRSPEGCPWDREQTHESLKRYLLEETYEVIESIDRKDEDKLIEELGDVLLQVVFHCQIARERGAFDMLDVITRVCRKMIDRHTHIFGTAVVENSQQVLENWEDLKKREKGFKTHTQVLRDIPAVLPALVRSYKVQEKAAMVGFDWDSVEGALDKVNEELEEVKEVSASKNNRKKIEEEIGDLLFAVVNVARFLGVDPELALVNTVEKFINRFAYIEQNAKRPLKDMTLEEMDRLWEQAKTLFSGKNDV
ncbi:MAG: nucleoside triphosphate pyrophosphohydrolase [Clostridiales bacterium]|nr:nucleoside triphosphate pyrophosphohydrolase [Clostridiales bacterium]